MASSGSSKLLRGRLNPDPNLPRRPPHSRSCLWPEKVQTPPDRPDDFTGGFSGIESSRTNTTGWPTVDVPIGRDADTGIPVGLNILAPLGGDALALQVGIDYQARFPYHLDSPTEL